MGVVDRRSVASHSAAEISGLCDVDSEAIAMGLKDHPNAFTCKDYREAFTKHVDKFDAVIVSVPDHSHAPILLTAMAHNKHVYGQKPLVHQLEELVMMEKALAARPNLVTQLGNQRMVYAGRRAAVDILRSGTLGKAIEAHICVSPPSLDDNYFNMARRVGDPSAPPANLDWDLWLGPCPKVDYRPGIAPFVWRSWWEYGTNGLGDWGCHVLDVVFFGYDELVTPFAVQTDCMPSPNPLFHTQPCRSTLTYAVSSDKFTKKFFPIYFSDSAQAVSRAAVGLPSGKFPGPNIAVVVCEGGVLVLSPDGRLEIWRDGKVTPGLKMPGLPDYPPLDHWHAWVDNCLGKKTELRAPFKDAVRITEPVLLAVKASRFPGQELRWDKANLTFTNNEEASKTIVRRNYREGYAPPVVS